MGLNTYPYSPFPASTEQLHRGDNEQIQAEIDSINDEVATLKSGLTNAEIALSVPVGTGRNKLDISGFETNTKHNITVTQNNNGTVTVTGTAPADATDLEQLGTVTKAGKYILTGCPAGGSNSSFRLDVRRGANIIAYDYGTGTGPVDMQIGDTINLRYANQYEVPEGGLLFKPMLRLSTDTNTTFAPYIPSVESRINALETEVPSLLSISSGTITMGEKLTGDTTEPSSVKKSGKTVQLWINATANAAVTAFSDILFTVGENYRPSTVLFVPVSIGNNFAMLRIGTGGGVLSSVNISENDKIQGCVTFLTA